MSLATLINMGKCYGRRNKEGVDRGKWDFGYQEEGEHQGGKLAPPFATCKRRPNRHRRQQPRTPRLTSISLAMASWCCPVAYSRLASPSSTDTASGMSRRFTPRASAFFLWTSEASWKGRVWIGGSAQGQTPLQGCRAASRPAHAPCSCGGEKQGQPLLESPSKAPAPHAIYISGKPQAWR